MCIFRNKKGGMYKKVVKENALSVVCDINERQHYKQCLRDFQSSTGLNFRTPGLPTFSTQF